MGYWLVLLTLCSQPCPSRHTMRTISLGSCLPMSKNTVRLHIVLRIFLVIAILVLLVLSIYHSYTSNTINDDTGWAISNGWHLLSQGFHYSLSNSWVVKHPYLSTGPEWLSDALFYWLYLHFGWGGWSESCNSPSSAFGDSPLSVP